MITVPSGCIGTKWLYKVDSVPPLPTIMQISFDYDNNEMSWGVVPDNGSLVLEYGTFTLTITGILQDEVFRT